MIRHRLSIPLLVFLLLGRPAFAGDQQRDSKETRQRLAKKACLNGETDRGIKLLTDLYVDTNDPTYIFNQGRCYEQGGLYREAIERFREYLRKIKTATEAERAEVNKHIADCQALLDAQKQNEPVRVEVSPPAKVEAALPATEAPQQAKDSVEAAPTLAEASPAPRSEGSGLGLRIAGIVATSVGVAAIATGVVLNLKHNSIIHGLRTNFDADTYATTGDYKTGAIVGYAVGATCIATGAILYFLRTEQARNHGDAHCGS